MFIESHHGDWKFRRMELSRFSIGMTYFLRESYRVSLYVRRAVKAQETYQVTVNTVNRLDALFRPVAIYTR